MVGVSAPRICISNGDGGSVPSQDVSAELLRHSCPVFFVYNRISKDRCTPGGNGLTQTCEYLGNELRATYHERFESSW